MSRALEVVALAARTPVGLIAETSAAAVRAGISRLEEYPYALASGEPVIAAHDLRLEHEVLGPRRIEALLASVLDEIERKLGDTLRVAGHVRVLLALPQSRPGFSDDDAIHLARAVLGHLRSKSVDASVDIAGHDHAGGIMAAQRAASEHGAGMDVPFVVIGVDSYLDLRTLSWLDRNRLLAQPGVPNGFVPGEAAACMVLASGPLRRRMGWPCLAVLSGAATAHEAQPRESDVGSLGVGLTRAVLEAAAPLHGAEVDTIYIDINGERYRSEEWGFVALRTQALWRSLDYEARAMRGATWEQPGHRSPASSPCVRSSADTPVDPEQWCSQVRSTVCAVQCCWKRLGYGRHAGASTMSVTINSPKTPVTRGSKGVAAATLPNPCKMPGPPPPFVPTPLPNVGKSGDSPKGYTKSVKVEGQPAAIRGASFGSRGDMASKATGGGLVSATTHGRTTFVGPGSRDVKFEGKSVQLLGDPMFNNCGAGGRTPNSATMVGVLQESGLLVLAGDEVCSLCGKEHEDAGKLEETVDTQGDADVLHAAVERAVAKAKAERDRRVAPERARLEAKAQQDYEARRSKLEANMKAARAHGRMEAAAKIEGQLARLRPAPVNVSMYDVTLAAMLGVVRCKDGQVFAGTSSEQYTEIVEELPGGWHALVGQYSLVDGTGPAEVDRFAKLAKFVSDKDALTEAWSRLEVASEQSMNGTIQEPFYPPGCCAAQQVLVLALEHGARPVGLTERWYKAGSPDATVAAMVRDSKTSPPRLASFGGEDAVPPCGTCQVILTMLLCPDECGPDCEHHAPAQGVCRCT